MIKGLALNPHLSTGGFHQCTSGGDIPDHRARFAVRLGATGGDIHAAVMRALAGAPFAPLLNPGHLVSIDEWSHTPIRAGSNEPIASGMAFQCDIIPAPLPDGVPIAGIAGRRARKTRARIY